MEGERVFRGMRMQRGYGLGGFFASMFRRALPLFKSGGKYLARKATQTGLSTLRDIANGVSPRTAVKRRIADVSDEMLDDVKRKIRRKMTGGGHRRKRRRTQKRKKKVNRVSIKRKRIHKKKEKRQNNKKKVCKRKIKDIFEM